MDDNPQQPTNNPVRPTPNRGGIPIETSSLGKRETVIDDLVSDPQKVMNANTPSAPNPAPNPVSNLQHVGGPKGKEHEPMPAPFPDVVKMNEKEIRNEEFEVERELESLIEKSPSSEKPKIPPAAEQAGMEHSGEDQDMPPINSGYAALPMSYDEAEFIKKKNKYHWKNSIAWLATIIMYHWKRINMSSKNNKE